MVKIWLADGLLVIGRIPYWLTCGEAKNSILNVEHSPMLVLLEIGRMSVTIPK